MGYHTGGVDISDNCHGLMFEADKVTTGDQLKLAFQLLVFHTRRECLWVHQRAKVEVVGDVSQVKGNHVDCSLRPPSGSA